MALDNSKSGFGFDMEERLKKVPPALTSTSTSTPMKENRSRRLYATVKPSTFEELERIAAHRDTSVNNLVNEILENYVK